MPHVRPLALVAALLIAAFSPAAAGQTPDSTLAADVLSLDLLSERDIAQMSSTFDVNPSELYARVQTRSVGLVLEGLDRVQLEAAHEQLLAPALVSVRRSMNREPDGRLADIVQAGRFADITVPTTVAETAEQTARQQLRRQDPALYKLLDQEDLFGSITASMNEETSPLGIAEAIRDARQALGGASHAEIEIALSFWESRTGKVLFDAFNRAIGEVAGEFLANQMLAIAAMSEGPPPPPAPVAPALDPERRALARELAYQTPIGQRLLYHLRTPTDDTFPLRQGRTAVDTLVTLVAQRMTPEQIQASIDFYRSAPFKALWAIEDAGYRALDEDARGEVFDAAQGRSAAETRERVALVRRLLEAQERPGHDAARLVRVRDQVSRYYGEFDVDGGAYDQITTLIEKKRAAPMISDAYVDYVLGEYPDTDQSVFRDAAVFYESPAGVLLVDAFLDAGDRMSVPYSVAMWADWLQESSVDVYDVVEQQPELIGGLEALQRRVEYPAAARDAGIQGRVFIQFVVDERGQVQDAMVTRSPSPILSDAALAAVLGSQFVPGMQDGRPVKVRFMLPVNFVLDGGGSPKRIYDSVGVPAFVIGGAEAVEAAVVYPPSARADGVTGVVQVQLVVEADGLASGFRVLGAPDERLATAAIQAMYRLRFEPGREGGRIVSSRLTVSVPFTLDS